MRTATVTSALALLTASATAIAIPQYEGVDFDNIKYPEGTGENLDAYPAPPGGWESIDWEKIDYPAGTGENLDSYPAPPGGWESIDWDKIDYPAGTGATPGKDDTSSGCSNGPFAFTSVHRIAATPDQVVNGTEPTGGLAGASGVYTLGLNSALDLICYSIELTGFRGDYDSPARTATHLHEAAKGESGPPRIAFENPQGEGDVRRSYGCQSGPFTTGLDDDNGVDTGNGFSVAQIEANPAAFFIDVHSSLAVPGAVRGQLA